MSQNPEWTSLCAFADSKPLWDLIVEMSEAMVSKSPEDGSILQNTILLEHKGVCKIC